MPDAIAMSALSHREPICAGEDSLISMTEIVGRGMIDLRIQPPDQRARDAVREVLGIDLPGVPRSSSCKDECTALWLSIDRFLIITPLAECGTQINALSLVLFDHITAVTDVSDARAVIRLTGSSASDLIKKGSPSDLGASSPIVGAVSRMPLGDIPAVVHVVQTGAEIIDLYVDRSYGESAWVWLVRAARRQTELHLFTRQQTPPV